MIARNDTASLASRSLSRGRLCLPYLGEARIVADASSDALVTNGGGPAYNNEINALYRSSPQGNMIGKSSLLLLVKTWIVA